MPLITGIVPNVLAKDQKDRSLSMKIKHAESSCPFCKHVYWIRIIAMTRSQVSGACTRILKSVRADRGKYRFFALCSVAVLP
jgi:hypothetical protein